MRDKKGGFIAFSLINHNIMAVARLYILRPLEITSKKRQRIIRTNPIPMINGANTKRCCSIPRSLMKYWWIKSKRYIWKKLFSFRQYLSFPREEETIVFEKSHTLYYRLYVGLSCCRREPRLPPSEIKYSPNGKRHRFGQMRERLCIQLVQRTARRLESFFFKLV